MQKRLLVGNWKMNLGAEQAKELVHGLQPLSSTLKHSEVWIAAPFVHLAALSHVLSGRSFIKLGAQNVHWEKSGAFTGEISVPMLKELGVTFSLVGHSERRHLFSESDQLAASRSQVAGADFKIIFCVGETLAERESGKTEAVLERQLKALTDKASTQNKSAIILAYEPVWAIGTGKVASAEDIQSAHSFIDSFWREHAGGAATPILYGGSVAPDNFQLISQIPLVAGALVGGASLSLEKFSKLIQIAEM